MPLKDRVARMENIFRVSESNDGAEWWENLLTTPEVNESTLNAAFLMAVNDIVPKPPPPLWIKLEERFRGDVEEWPIERVLFAVAYSELEHEGFATAEGKNGLCYLALSYWHTFHSGPWIGSDAKARHQDALGSLQDVFIGPLFWRLHDVHRATDWTTSAWSAAAFTSWIEWEQVVEFDALFQSLLDWIGGRK